jgi:hypothetical protein
VSEVVSQQPDRWGADRAEYPWEDWLDGQIWSLEESSDYLIASELMEYNVVLAAAREGKWVRTQVQRTESLPAKLFIQAIDEPDGTESELEFKPR